MQEPHLVVFVIDRVVLDIVKLHPMLSCVAFDDTVLSFWSDDGYDQDETKWSSVDYAVKYFLERQDQHKDGPPLLIFSHAGTHDTYVVMRERVR